MFNRIYGTNTNLICLNKTAFLSLLVLIGCSSSEPREAPTSEIDTTQINTFPQVSFGACPFDTTETSSAISCGVLDTFENYELTGPDARMIEIAFGIVPATVTPAVADPIVVFNGGPGASVLVEFALGIELKSYSGNRDIILVDQRGTGFSEPFLNCDLSDDSNEEDVTACIDGFLEEGVDLRQYRSAVIAQDFKSLREALEIEQWNVYGESYGPIPGLLYADLDPTGVRSVVLDSSTNNQVDIALADAAAPLNFITELARQCALETECVERLPDLSSVFIDTFRSLNSDPWIVEIPGFDKFEFTGDFLFELARLVDGIDYPLALDVFANRNAEVLVAALIGTGTDDTDDTEGDFPDINSDLTNRIFANLMGNVVQCAAIDVDNFVSATLPTSGQWPDDVLTAARNRLSADYPFFCAAGFVDIEQDLSQIEPRLLSVPALVLGGGLDTLVSLQEVQRLAESFTSPVLAISPKDGHVIGFPEADIDLCIRGIVASFLDTPSTSPDISCLSDNIEPYGFALE